MNISFIFHFSLHLSKLGNNIKGISQYWFQISNYLGITIYFIKQFCFNISQLIFYWLPAMLIQAIIPHPTNQGIVFWTSIIYIVACPLIFVFCFIIFAGHWSIERECKLEGILSNQKHIYLAVGSTYLVYFANFDSYCAAMKIVGKSIGNFCRSEIVKHDVA